MPGRLRSPAKVGPAATNVAASGQVFGRVVKAAGREPVQAGRFCCSMYCRRTLNGAPPTDPAKYEPDHSRLARQ